MTIRALRAIPLGVTTARPQWILRALAILVALAALLVIGRRAQVAREDAARSEPTAEARTAEPVVSPPTTAEVGDARATREEPARAEPRTQPPWARVYVTGRVEGARGEESKPVVIVRPRLGELGHHGAATTLAAWTYLTPDGTYRADVSHCFKPDDETLLAELHVQLSSSSRLPLERVVAVPFSRADLERGGELAIPVDFELTPLCEPEISVVLPVGDAREVTLVALTLRGEQPGEELAVWSERVEGRGRVDMALPCNEPLLLVACADGLRPCTLRLPARASLAVLELEAGAAIEGWLRSGDVPHIASFTAWPLGRGRARDVEVGPLTLVWLQGRFEWPLPHARSGDEGEFRLGGLIPGQPYDLRWRDDLEALQDEHLFTVIAGEGALQLDMGKRSVGVFLRARDPDARQLDVELLSPAGEQRKMPLSLPLDAAWWLQADVGTRVRVLDRAGVTLGETVVGESARTTLEL